MTATKTKVTEPVDLLAELREAVRGLTADQERAADNFLIGWLSADLARTAKGRKMWRDAVAAAAFHVQQASA